MIKLLGTVPKKLISYLTKLIPTQRHFIVKQKTDKLFMNNFLGGQLAQVGASAKTSLSVGLTESKNRS